MPGINDPSLLLFAGNLLSGTGGGQGFGGSLGNALTGAGQSVLLRQQQDRQRQQDLIGAAESAIGIRAALGELQAQQRQQEAEAAYLGGLPEDQRAVAAVNPREAALNQLPEEITPYQEANLELARQGQGLDERQFEAAQEQQQFANELALREATTPAKPKLSDVSSLRSQYIKESGPFKDIATAYKKVLGASKNAAGDLSLIFSYMKILDPTSVVRESEQATAANAAGVPERIRNAWNRVILGERLTDEQHQRYKREAGIIFEQQFKTQQAVQKGFVDIAGRAGMEPQDITQAVKIETPQEIRASNIDSRIKRAGVSLSDVDETAQIHGLTIEQVLDQLEASGG